MNSSLKCESCKGTGRVGYWLGHCGSCGGAGWKYPPSCACPSCGSMIVSYGGGWRCAALYCWHNASNPIANMGPEPDWWRDGTRVFKDGDAWCATRADFENLQESPAGFGNTPQAAVDQLRAAIAKARVEA